MPTRRTFLQQTLAAFSLPFLSKIECHAQTGASNKNTPHMEEQKLSAAGFPPFDPLPPYYTEYLQQRIKEIHKLISTNGPFSDTFFFFTDTHFPSNHLMTGKLIGYLMQKTMVNKAFFGGDVCPAFGGKDVIDQAILSQAETYYPYIKPWGALYNMKGNHDFTINNKNSDAPESWTYSSQSAHNFIMGRASLDNLVTNENDPEACYYYVDNTLQHIRYIVIDTSDTAHEGKVAWGVAFNFGKKQAQWIAEKAILTTPKGWSIVVMAHIPPITPEHIYEKKLADFITAAANRQKVQIFDTVFDFTANQGQILCFLGGHMHQDMQTYHKGLLHLVTSCDACYQDYRFSPLFHAPDIPQKIKGTIWEQTFDVVNIDREANRIDMLRIGGGYNRHFHLKPIILHKGSKALPQSLFMSSDEEVTPASGAEPTNDTQIKWYASDTLGYKQTADKIWQIPCTVISIDEHGNITAQTQGEAIIWAQKENGEKEFFYVVVK